MKSLNNLKGLEKVIVIVWSESISLTLYFFTRRPCSVTLSLVRAWVYCHLWLFCPILVFLYIWCVFRYNCHNQNLALRKNSSYSSILYNFCIFYFLFLYIHWSELVSDCLHVYLTYHFYSVNWDDLGECNKNPFDFKTCLTDRPVRLLTSRKIVP
jgi:hypothetical protein